MSIHEAIERAVAEDERRREEYRQRRALRGIHIEPLTAVPDTDGCFRLLFEPVLVDLCNFWWVFGEPVPVEPECVSGPGEWRALIQEIEQLPHAGGECNSCLYTPPGDYLDRWARHIDDDWNDFYGFGSKPDVDAFIAARGSLATDDLIATFLPDRVFLAMDGSFWEFYAADAELLRCAREHAATFRGVKVHDVSVLPK